MNASVLLVAREDATAFAALVESLAASNLGSDVEVVIADDCAVGPVRRVLDQLAGDVEIVRVGEVVSGRRVALAAAATAARADVCIALSTRARVRPGFDLALAAAVRGGADIAGPEQVLTLDCVAARREWFASGLAPMRPLDGSYEAMLTRGLAHAHVPDVVGRTSVGPPASVIICTRDRAADLTPCVEAVVAQGADDVVLVDSCSSDATPTVCAALVERFGGVVTVVREAQPGLSRARNSGARHARHDVLLYLDDDARPVAGWLDAMRDAFADPANAIAGGPIHALADGPVDTGELPDAWAFLVSALSLGDADAAIPASRGPWGANWGCRRDVLDAVGGFDERFGPGPTSAIGGEESQVGRLVERTGRGDIAYRVGAVVGHRVPRSRVARGYLAMRAFRVGVGEVLVRADDDARAHLSVAAEHVGAAIGREARGTADAVLAAITAADLPATERLYAAARLGNIAACALRLGLDSVRVPGGGRIAIHPRHGRGFVEQPGSGPMAAGW